MQHLAIIIDGNGRWAEKQGLKRINGHEKGALALERAVKDFVTLDIDVLTFYAFSTENVKREPKEVSNLLGVIAYFLNNKISKIVNDNDMRVRFIGDLSKLPTELLQAISSLNANAINNKGKLLVFAINYGGSNEVCRAFDKIFKQKNFFSDNSPITEEQLFDALDTANLVSPDAILRYGGYHRLSNFLPLQAAYSELFFIDKLWPDYEKTDIENVINDFKNIKRNFGGINAQEKDE